MAMDMSVALKITAGVQGEQGIDRLNSKLRDVGRQGEMSAKQIAQAYRTLPAQFQDVAVSLAGGQNPLMVLLQQGSQVATQFGGMGNAIRGIAAILSPAKIAFAGAAAAVGGFALAAYQGYQESIKLQRQLAITGNYAGLTADAFERSAGRIKQATGATASATRELLMGAAGSGTFGPASIEAAAQAMTRLQRLTGQSSEDVVKLFSGMRSGVADWAAETNKSYNYLTVEQYKYIRQLEDQGLKEQAMIVASNALNDALKNRTVELGYLDRAWNSVKNGASNAWNAMLNIGRPDTLADQIKAVQATLSTAQALRDGMQKRGQTVPEKSNELLQLEAQLAALQETARMNERLASSKAANASAQQLAIAKEREAEEERKRAQNEAKSREQQRIGMIQGLQNEILKLTQGEDALTIAKMRSLGASEQQIQQVEALLKQRASGANAQQVADTLKDLNSEVDKLIYSENTLTIAKLKASGATADQIAEAERLISKQAELRGAIEAGKRTIADEKRQQDELKQTLQSLNDEVQKMIVGEDEMTIAKMRKLGATEQEIAQARTLMTQRAQMLAADRELEKATKEQTKIEEDARRSKEQLAEAGKRVFEETRTPLEKLNAEYARLSDLLQKGAIDWDTYGRAIFKAQDDFDGLSKKGKDTMSELTQAVEGWGRQATDTFVEFAFTGKATFKDLVTSILKDIARMLIQKAVMAPLMNAISGSFAFANGGVMTDTGPVPLETYANGGVAKSPQLALFGEGRMPEAYVPLPDGRTIPVTMTGEGAGGATNVVVNVNVESGETQVNSNQGEELGRLVAGVVRAELINQKRPGGLLAA